MGVQGAAEPGVVAGELLALGSAGGKSPRALVALDVGRLGHGQERLLGGLEERPQPLGVGLAGEVVDPELVGLGHADLERVHPAAQGVVELVLLFQRLAVVKALGGTARVRGTGPARSSPGRQSIAFGQFCQNSRRPTAKSSAIAADGSPPQARRPAGWSTVRLPSTLETFLSSTWNSRPSADHLSLEDTDSKTGTLPARSTRRKNVTLKLSILAINGVLMVVDERVEDPDVRLSAPGVNPRDVAEHAVGFRFSSRMPRAFRASRSHGCRPARGPTVRLRSPPSRIPARTTRC